MLPILVFVTLFQLASAHGRISLITTSDGTTYPGWDPDPETGTPSLSPQPALAAWSASNLGNIFISPSSFNTTDIACHISAKAGKSHVVAHAGTTINLRWNEWPVSHKGPVLSYLAACPGTLNSSVTDGSNGDCSLAKASDLEFVKSEHSGLLSPVDPTGVTDAGIWGSDTLISNNFTWHFNVPSTLKPGAYVLRHEIIALHVAYDLNGAQAYPQCVNLRILPSTNGKGTPRVWKDHQAEGATKFYGMRDPGILLNIHKNLTSYTIPGPPVWNGTTDGTQSRKHSRHR